MDKCVVDDNVVVFIGNNKECRKHIREKRYTAPRIVKCPQNSIIGTIFDFRLEEARAASASTQTTPAEVIEPQGATMAEATFKIEKDTLVITVPLDKKGTPSSTGKTMVHGSTRGNTNTGLQVNGKALIVGLNAYTKN